MPFWRAPLTLLLATCIPPKYVEPLDTRMPKTLFLSVLPVTLSTPKLSGSWVFVIVKLLVSCATTAHSTPSSQPRIAPSRTVAKFARLTPRDRHLLLNGSWHCPIP